MADRSTNFVRKVYEAAKRIGLKEPQARLAASQAALETGYGKSVKGNNFFGIKAGKSWKGPVQNFKTWEEYGGKRVNISDKFRKYESLDESLKDWANVTSKRWPEAMTAMSFQDAAKGLKYGQRGGYATDSKYGNKLSYIEKRIGDAFEPVTAGNLTDFATKTERGADLANIMAGQSGSPTGPGIFDAFNAVANTNLTATPTPQAKPANPANRAFADNAVGNLVDPRQANTSPRTVEEMLSGAPEGTFLPGGPIERYLSRQDRPAPLEAAPRGIVERGRDLGPLPSRNAPATVSRNAFDTMRGSAPSGMFGPMADVANARVANAFADVAQPRNISAVATSDVDPEIQAGLSRNPFDTMRGTPAGELPAVPGVSYVAPQPTPQVAQPAPTVAPPTVQQAMQPLQAPRSVQPRQVFTDIPTRTVTGAVPGVAEKVAEYGGAADPGNGMSYGRSPFGSGVALVHDNAPDYVKTAATGPGLFGAFERDFGIDLEPMANKALIGGAGLVAGPALMTGGALLGGGIGAGVAGLAPFAARQVGNKYGGGLFGDPFNDQVQANRQAARQNQAAQSNLSRPEMALRRGLSGGVDFLTGGMFRPDFGGGNGSMFGGGGNSSGGGLFGSIGQALSGLFGGRDRNDMGGGLFSGSNNLGGVGGRDASGALM